MASVHDVAAGVLELRSPMSTMKLQKLVYYCQAWHLVWYDEVLYDEPIEAWVGGPVIRELYREHRGSYRVSEWPHGNAAALDEDQRDTVKEIVASYGQLSGRQLGHLTHGEEPWKQARAGLPPGVRGNAVIDPYDMCEFYLGLSDDPTTMPVEELRRTLPDPEGEPA